LRERSGEYELTGVLVRSSGRRAGFCRSGKGKVMDKRKEGWGTGREWNGLEAWRKHGISPDESNISILINLIRVC
jgi:hypothetical protein